jgi:hypothetical protein
MRRLRRSMLVILGVLGVLGTGQARAQFGYSKPPTSPFNQPTVSPYLNMARGGNAAINYNTLVRPQIDTGRAIQQLQSQVSQDQQVLIGQFSAAPTGYDASAALPLTGHPVQFMNYAHYYTPAAGNKPGSSQPSGSALPVGVRR